MKSRYSFLSYIITMTCYNGTFLSVSTFLICSVVILLLTYSFAFSIVWGIAYTMLSAVIGIVVGFSSSILVSLLSFIFFKPDDIGKRIFRILSFGIVIILGFGIGDIGWKLVLGDTTRFLSIATTLTLPIAHYFAVPNLVTPIEKRKEKAH